MYSKKIKKLKQKIYRQKQILLYAFIAIGILCPSNLIPQPLTKTSLSQDMMEFFDDVAPTPEFRTIAADFAPDYLGFLDYQKYKQMNRADKTIESNKIFNVKGTGIR